jgi:hypothetical protein
MLRQQYNQGDSTLSLRETSLRSGEQLVLMFCHIQSSEVERGPSDQNITSAGFRLSMVPTERLRGTFR